MNYLIAFLFIVAGLINFAPITGVFADQLDKLYQIGDISTDVELLMRHRAILFGIVGAIILAAAFVPGLRLAATIAGLVSMLSFIALVFAGENSNPNLIQIAWIDVGATLALLLGFILHLAAASD